MANPTFPYYPPQDNISPVLITADVAPPTEKSNKQFSNRGDSSLKNLRDFSIEIQSANSQATARADTLATVVTELQTFMQQAQFPLKRAAYQGAFASNPAVAQVRDLAEGDIYFNTTELEMYIYSSRSGTSPQWLRISSLFDPASSLVITSHLRYTRRVDTVVSLPTSQTSVTLDLNQGNYFQLATDTQTTVNFVYNNSAFEPDSLEFTLEVFLMPGGSLQWQSGRVAFSNELFDEALQDTFKKHLLRFKSSRGAESFFVRIEAENVEAA